MRYRFTQREIDKALDSLVIILDSREQDGEGYKKEWERDKIKTYSKEDYDFLYSSKKKAKKDLYEAVLPAGDYSAMLPAGTLRGIDRALWFDMKTVVEKKGSINELAGNIGKKDLTRLRNEFARLKANGTRHRIFIEDTLYFKHLYEGSGNQKHGWSSQESLSCAISRELSNWETELIPIPKEYMAREIYKKLKYDVRDILMKELNITELEEIEDEN